MAHVFLVDENKQLNHIAISDEKIIARELLGKIKTEPPILFDTIEHPPGKLRVIAGDKQYFRDTPDQNWQEVKGNRCARFVPVDDETFCAFVIKGEEINAPERNDYTVGWFFLAPIVFWSHEQTSKLVLAQESQNGWIIRAVVDPDILMDATGDFMIETDSLGKIHCLYFTSIGGGLFILFPAGIPGGFGFVGPEPKLRHAQFTIEQLLSHPKYVQNLASSNDSTQIQWMSIKGNPLTYRPFVYGWSPHREFGRNVPLSPLNMNVSLNKVTGELNTLMRVFGCALIEGKRISIIHHGILVELTIRDGQVSPSYNAIAAKDYPTSKYGWLDSLRLIKIDSNGNKHVLLKGVKPGKKSQQEINYLLGDNTDWSAPISLDNCNKSSCYYGISLAVGDSGEAFATWDNEEGKLIGRWIKPQRGNIR